MSYPKPLSQKSIDKLLSSWDPHTVDVLHTYYEAFSNLYGAIHLNEAWNIFKTFEPKIKKKEFIDFSSIARRKDVPYYIFEINELFCDEKPKDTDRFIVNREIIGAGYYKHNRFYDLLDEQADKPFYAEPDLLKVASHRLHDEKLRSFVENMKYTDGENAGKKLSEVIVLTKDEEIDMDYYKNNKALLKYFTRDANLPLSEKIIRQLTCWMEFSIESVPEYLSNLLEEVNFSFKSEGQAQQFFALAMDFLNNSHQWANRGFTPVELRSLMMSQTQRHPSISFGPGIQKSFENGDLDREEIMRYLKAKGLQVED